ncbi:MAG: LPXTG cell wall anchor domain-containing protein [Clostridia bacterium]|nr:LPXTG cell wall anchor domain-containing protein [Clostridia bacterium]
MKIAKKALVVLMVAMMVASMSAMAFAAGGQYALTASAEDGVVELHVYAKDAIGLKSADMTITYDAAVLEYDYTEDGADAAQVGDTKSNSFSSELNAGTAGTIEYSFYFKTELVSKDDFAADAKKNKTVDINAENFEAGIIYFNVKDENATSTVITVASKNEGVNGGNVTVTLKEEPASEEKPSEDEEASKKAEEEASKKAAEEAASKKAAEEASKKAAEEASKKAAEEKTTKAEEKTTKAEEKTTKAPSTTKAAQKDGGVNTGDNMALAAAAGVVALAGAAFVLTKKRK